MSTGSLRLQQLGAVLKKSYILKMKTPKMTLFELLFPVLILGVLVVSKDKIGSTALIQIFLMTLSLCLAIIISKLTHLIVTEREERISEMMKILGLPSWIHYTGWFIFYALTMFVMNVIIVAIIIFAKILENTNGFLLFVLLMVFSTSSIAFSQLLSVPFDSAKAAQSFTFLVYYITQYTSYLIKDWSPEAIHVVMFFFPSLTFSKAMDTVVSLDKRFGADWASVDSLAPYDLNTCMLLLGLSTIAYFVLYVYLDQVVPHAVGSRRHPLFFLSWFKKMFTSAGSRSSSDVRSESMSLVGDEEKVVRISGLSKSYDKTKPALSDLTVDLLPGELTVLLGRNGAGKTTMINILTGMAEPSKGRASIFGHSVVSDMSTIRAMNLVGLCPQHDILWNNLTVDEHFDIFGNIRGLSKSVIHERSMRLLTSLGLVGKEKETVSALSGGMKRKLSVALSFLGDPRFVILDEPTSGLDPLSRRHMWEILGKLREDRVMLLSTHYMDEAEVLGERVMILSEGVLKANGTVNELKLQYNCGYELRFYTNTGSKFTSFDKLKSVVGSVLGTDVRGVVVGPGTEGSVANVLLPIDSGTKLEGLLKEIQLQFVDLNVLSKKIDIYSKRLEEVFIKVSMEDGNLEELVIPVSDDDDAAATSSDEENGHTSKTRHVVAQKIQYTDSKISLFLSQVIGTILKRYRMIIREKRTALIEYAFPMVMLGMGVWVREIAMKDGKRAMKNAGNVSKDDVENATGAFPVYDMIMIVFVIIAVTSVASTVVSGLNREKSSQSKFLQFVAGLTPGAYWTGSLVVDLIEYYCIPFSFAAIMVAVADINVPTSPLFVLLAFYGPAIMAQTYLVSVAVPNDTFGRYLSMILNTVFGMVMPMVIIGLSVGKIGTDSWLPIITGILYVFPSFNLGYGMYVMFLHLMFAKYRDSLDLLSESELEMVPSFFKADGVYDFSVLGGPIIFLIAAAFVLFALTIVIDDLIYKHKFTRTIGMGNTHARTNDVTGGGILGVDDDSVERERAIAAVPNSKYVLRVNSVSKRYNSHSRPAVSKVPLAVSQNGEIFTILGENGAGKTTLVKMAIGEILPSAGNIYIGQHDSQKSLKEFRQQLGYCPQFDALALQLTVKDHLRMYARIKGVRSESIDVAVKQIVDWLGLGKYANRKAKALSGGYRRRLSLAIALMGQPSIVFLDEPSCGMDPIARRQMWTVMESASRKCAIVLTTHSMEEAESVSTRLGIMSKGRMVCLGTAPQLREKFSNGLEIFIQTSTPSFPVVDTLANQFRNARTPFVSLAESHSAKRKMRFLTSGMSLIGNVMTSGVPDPVLIPTFSEWWAQEDLIDAIEIEVGRNLRTVLAFEASGRSVRFVVSPDSKIVDFDLVGSVFATLSGLKQRNYIVDYSLTLNSLDQVFRSIASKELEADALAVHGIQY